MRLLKFSSVILLLLGAVNSKAVTTQGTDITYRFLNGNKYEIKITIHRDCTGINIGGIKGTARAGLKTTEFTPTKKGIRDLTHTCAIYESACANRHSGLGIGYEEHTFIDTIDFEQAPYINWIDSSHCEISFEWSQCCRNGEITTINNNAYFNSAIINVCNLNKTSKKNNSTPQFTSDLLSHFCCNEPLNYNVGALDKEDYDSLSYALVRPKSSYNNYLTYKTPFDSLSPMTSRCIPQGNKCTPRPYAKPPLGFFLDPVKGDIVFTPTKCDEVGIVVVEVKEWRKDTNGNYLHIGTTRRDFQFIIMNCGNNVPPKMTASNYDFTICEGEKVRIEIEATDNPHPSNPNGKKDTVTLSWNGGLSTKGTFTTRKDTNNRDENAIFEWQTKIGDAQETPYTFTVKAIDDACPIYAESIKSFSIKVLPKIKILSKSYSTFCDKIIVHSKAKEEGNGPFKYSWYLYDSTISNNPIDSSKSSIDTFTVESGATFYAKLIIKNTADCSIESWDTIRFKPELSSLYLGKDFVSGYLDSVVVHAGPDFNTYLWNDNSKDSTLAIYPIQLGEGSFNYSVEITNSNGCKYEDDINITIDACKNNISPTLYTPKSSYIICEGDKIAFDIDVRDTTSLNYHRIDAVRLESQSNFGSFHLVDSTAKNKKGSFSFQTFVGDAALAPFNAKFKYFDDACPNVVRYKNIEINVLEKPEASLNNYEVCGIYNMKAQILKFENPIKFDWEIKDNNTTQTVFTSKVPFPKFTIPKQSSYNISLKLENGNGCFLELKETKTLSPYEFKDLIGGDRVLFTLDTLVLNPGSYSKYYWSDQTNNATLHLVGQDLGKGKTNISLRTTDNNGCDYFDTIEIDVQCSPNTLDIGGDLTIDLWDNITLSSDRDYNSYLWNTNSTNKSIDIETHLLGAGTHTYSLTAKDKANCTYSDEMQLTVSNLTEISELGLNSIKVYPSPTRDFIHIDLPISFNEGKIEVINLIGKTVLTKEMANASSDNYTVDVSNLPKGFYILKLTTGTKRYLAKLIKE